MMLDPPGPAGCAEKVPQSENRGETGGWTT